jgi:hypothetical protein
VTGYLRKRNSLLPELPLQRSPSTVAASSSFGEENVLEAFRAIPEHLLKTVASHDKA